LPVALVALFCIGHLPQERTTLVCIAYLTCQTFALLAHLETAVFGRHNLLIV